MKEVFTTNRLVLREFAPEEAEGYYRLNSDPQVIKHTGDDPFATIEDARTFLENYSHYQSHGYGRWSVYYEGKLIGWCGLKFHENEDYVDLGFRFFRSEWNNGFATEASVGSINYGFKEYGLKRLVGRVASSNLASIRVLEKLGFTFWKNAPCEGIKDSLYFILRKEDWESKHSGREL